MGWAGLSARFSDINFNERFSRDVGEAVSEQIKEAVRRGLKVAIPMIPVYSGAARAALRPLAEALGVDAPIAIELGAVRSRKAPFSNEFGIAAGEAAGHDWQFYSTGRNIGFKFRISMAHFRANELLNMRPPINLIYDTPWNAFNAWRAEIRTYLKQNLIQNLPKVNDYLVRTRRTAGKGK